MKIGIRSTKVEFIKKAELRHGNKYDYSKVEYINNYTKIIIICPIHGEFEQAPVDHLRTGGCRLCSNKKMANTKMLTVDQFKEKANKIHNNKYDYSDLLYIGNQGNIKIGCPLHGTFEQKANNHMQGYGCPSCNSSKGELLIRDYLISKNIKFEEQKRFNNCILNKPLPFDFYLPNHNLLIEFDGVAHFKPTTFGGMSLGKAKDKLIEQKERDQIKSSFAENNNIALIRISYLKIKNIEKILDSLIL